MNGPPTAGILAIGDELLGGETLDRNSAWISSRLAELGIGTGEHRTVGDDASAIAGAFAELRSRHGVVISTGGLGPTLDDCTRPGLAESLGEPLVEDAEALAHLEAWFTGRGRPMPVANRTQALRPEGAICLDNPHGTAPGLLVGAEAGGLVACLPGPPREMQPMFLEQVRPRLAVAGEAVGRTRLVHACGAGESDLAARLGELMAPGRTPQVGITASHGVVTARIRSRGRAADVESQLDQAAGEIERRWAPYAFGRDATTLASATAADLVAGGRTLAVAESCTAGMLGEMLVAVSGASSFFEGGWLVYSNALKTSQLGVPESVLERHGAVSEPTAALLAMAAASRAGTDLALSVTGVAGPTGGSEHKPVGTVFIGLCDRRDGPARVRRFRFPGDRDAVRRRSATSAVAMLRLHIAGAGGTPLLWEWPE